MDERSQQIITKAMALTLGIVYISLFVLAIWKYVTTGDIASITWELIFIMMITTSIVWFSRKDESLLIPKMTTIGKEFPIENNKETKKKRTKIYALDAVGLATIFLILTVLDSIFVQKKWNYMIHFPEWNKTFNIIFTLSLEFIISIIIFFMIAFIWEEWKLRKYHKKMDELED